MPKKHTSKLQLEGSKKSAIKTPKGKSSKSTNVTKNKDKVQTDKNLKLDKHKLKKKDRRKDREKDAVKAKAAKKETKNLKEGESGSISASPSSTSDGKQNKKKLSTKTISSGGREGASESKSRKRYAFNIENSDEDMEDFVASQPTFPRPTKNRRLLRGKDEDCSSQPSSRKKRESVHNPAIWKIISGSTTESLGATEATTTIATGKANQDETETTTTVISEITTAMVYTAATGDIDSLVYEKARSGVHQLSIESEESRDQSEDNHADTAASGGQGHVKVPSPECLRMLDEKALEKQWAAMRGKLH
ncbi:hypothetical protein BGX24_003635 [Mortierella sp. AD032]|nr:hypothetical protein BGX24_003635 [Mortierella sp. AD032]